MSKRLAQLDRLGEVAGCRLDPMAACAEPFDHRAHHQHVRTVGQIDPDVHGNAPGIVALPVLVLASISETLVNEISHFVREAGLPGVFALMALGSACIPIPSEVVMLFAGFAVANPGPSASHHHMTMLGIIVAGLLGTLVGSWVAYGVGRGGRLELLERHGGKIHMGPAQIDRADRWFKRYGEPTVLFGRLVPVVRAFVSLPAGVAKMPLGRFTVLSLIGTTPWVARTRLSRRGPRRRLDQCAQVLWYRRLRDPGGRGDRDRLRDIPSPASGRPRDGRGLTRQ